MYKSHTILKLFTFLILCIFLCISSGCQAGKQVLEEAPSPTPEKVTSLQAPTSEVPVYTIPSDPSVPESTEVQPTEMSTTEPATETPTVATEPPTTPVDSVTFQSVDEIVYAKTDVNVRKGPGAEYDRIGYLPEDEAIRRIGIGSNGWSKVIFQNEEAYISSSYLATSKPSHNESPTAPPATLPPATIAPTQLPATEPPTTTPPATDAPPASTEKPHEHNYIAGSTVPPTCSNDGYTVYSCSCGDSYTGDTTPAVGHFWNDWVETKEPTADTEGERTRSCQNCSAAETQVVPKKETEKIDTAALTAYGNSYAASLGFTLDYSVRDGYFPPDTIIFTTMAAAKYNVAANVDVLYNNLMAAAGSIEGCRACVTVVDNGNGTYTTTVYYG
jgi:uncharacterized protein YgiM (DUF1202 family)